MAHAERCPVCGGSGKITDPDSLRTTYPVEKVCHGCWGKGWVEVSDR